MFCDAFRHFHQNAVDLSLFFFPQAYQLIVLLYGFERFDKHRLAAGTGAMHNALHAPFLLYLDRDNKAFIANRDQLFLHCSAFRKAPHIGAQGFLNRALLPLNVLANSSQLSRCAIFESAVGTDLVAECTQELREINDSQRKLRHGIPPSLHCCGRIESDFAPLRRAIHQVYDVADLFDLERRALDARSGNEFGNRG